MRPRIPLNLPFRAKRRSRTRNPRSDPGPRSVRRESGLSRVRRERSKVQTQLFSVCAQELLDSGSRRPTAALKSKLHRYDCHSRCGPAESLETREGKSSGPRQDRGPLRHPYIEALRVDPPSLAQSVRMESQGHRAKKVAQWPRRQFVSFVQCGAAEHDPGSALRHHHRDKPRWASPARFLTFCKSALGIGSRADFQSSAAMGVRTTLWLRARPHSLEAKFPGPLQPEPRAERIFMIGAAWRRPPPPPCP
jgi:hypothetical protein